MEMVVPYIMGSYSSQVKGVQCDGLTYVIGQLYLSKAGKKENKKNKNKESKKIGGTLRKGTMGSRKFHLCNKAVVD